ncbi:PREDICTED: disintegrin and metalloproteinase domain-containing protein 11 isoform X2 [Nicrophorus vespilloides]|uniref:Disintegrin and metalloproteinase domain-containing protein 11 isoform X2 n=1 Tax=Nicrophorus vespilloides TaxID=110193 RepID=A0ABM1NDA8_NICVS|nr:PREDICTED: disintegrin and metalloproteinase domain-containing protein 11 isoform X2 [Nicrophorus vespilloides]
MVRNIGSHYYQIIYPVQLRQHKKMGISTREIGSSKVRKARSTRGQGDGGYSGPIRGSGRQRTGKHFHRTSLLIKAFNHKFRLDLELNTQLIAPNIMQKHFLNNGAEQVSKQEIEHCYYHGTVQDYPGATAAFHTCNGVSGVIHVGNETFVIHPFYGGDLSQKHPHVIFEARTKANKGCANSGNMEWRLNPHSGFLPQPNDRLKRDVREATKYIETAMVIDKAMFEKRNGSTRAEVVHDAIQVANIADLYFRTLNTRVSVVYVETWQGGNQAQIDRSQDIGRGLSNFNDYTSRKLFKIDKDTTQLLTGEVFAGGEAGMAVPATVCTAKAVGISVDINTYEPHLLAGTMAHMIGHNIGMGHDDGREECFCRDWHGCIMAQAIVGLDNVQPYKFSECSRSDYIDRLRTGNGICLLNKPNELEVHRTCGNRIVEEGEECDCGSIDDCHTVDPCCDPITCKLTSEAECASGPCCEQCRLREKGVVCRDSSNECDLPEQCTGESGDCPADVFKKNGNPCGGDSGYCFNGFCPTHAIQCEHIWGYGGVSADLQCYDQFNSKGSINGHCGNDAYGRYVKCAPENVRCGSLQCQLGNRYPVVKGLDQLYTRTTISIKTVEYECKSTSSGSGVKTEVPHLGLVRDGTPCGENLICINQTCSSIFPHLDQTKCPTNNNDLECSGHGDCTNTNKCYCGVGWSGPDCSIEEQVTATPPLPTPPPEATKGMKDLAEIMKKKETPYESYHGSNTVFLVGTLMSVVGGVFIVFATMALCYRSVVVHKNFSLCLRKTTVRKYQKPYVKKPTQKNYVLTSGNHSASQEDTLNNADKIMSFGPVPAYGRTDSQRVLYRSSNHMGSSGPSNFQDHKMQQLKRIGVGGSGSEDDPTHSGSEEETVSFIDLQHNNLKLPEKKGILKKHDYGLVGVDVKDGWADGSQDNIMCSTDASMAQLVGGTSMSQVERTLKSLNGYHEDIIKALRNAATHRGTATPSGSTTALSEEVLRRSLQECAVGYPEYKTSGSKENVCEQQVVVEAEEEEEDEVPPHGPIRIRNLEDLIRQLEHHTRHMSPSGSEDIRMSETEADRHYRQESSSACSESSHQSHRDSRFVYGRYRQPTGRLPYPHPHPHPHHQAEEESIYESADHERGAPCGETPDSESDEFIQAQQQLARWASDDAVPQAGTSGQMPREYFPSPSSSTSEEPTSIVRAPAPVPPVVTAPHPEHATIHRPKRYPEYKH